VIPVRGFPYVAVDVFRTVVSYAAETACVSRNDTSAALMASDRRHECCEGSRGEVELVSTVW